MCTSEDLVFGHGIDGELQRLYDMMPDAFGDDPVAMVAALITLDEQLGLRQAGELTLLYTVRADDTFIYRPGFESQLAGNMTPRRLQDLPS